MLPNASRDPVDRITDSMLSRPLCKLSQAERAMIRRAVSGPRGAEFVQRVLAMRRRY